MNTRRLAADPSGIDEACRCLEAGGLVAFPTETVYGLGADATSSATTARIYAAKGRPSFNPLIAHLADREAAEREGIFDSNARRLADHFWPGPLTLVVPVRSGGSVSELSRAGLASVGLRVPSHPVAQALLKAFGKPVAAPSANRSGRISPTEAAHVLADLDGAIDAIIEAGASEVGLESTIVGCADGKAYLLRPGFITRAAIAEVIGAPVIVADAAHDATAPQSPGRLMSHYAPESPVRLNATRILPGEALLAFGPDLPEGSETASIVHNLSPDGNLTEAAMNLYSFLRFLDKLRPSTIAMRKFQNLASVKR